jgi:hypothetical protein
MQVKESIQTSPEPWAFEGIHDRHRRRTAIAKPNDESGWHEGNLGPALSQETSPVIGLYVFNQWPVFACFHTIPPQALDIIWRIGTSMPS